MHRAIRIVSVAFVGVVVLMGSNFAASSVGDRSEILKAREAVWRAWFANDTKTLQKLVPPDTIVISAGEDKWKTQAEVFQSAADFQKESGKLIRLEFPRTEIQRFGDVAIVWSKYLVETETNGKRSLTSGRVTEVFVRRHGQWTNPGWHTDSNNMNSTRILPDTQNVRSTTMTEKNVASAVAYYRAMADKDLTGMARYLHPDVHLISPMEELTGKEAVLAAVKPLVNLIKSIKVHAKFGSENQAMLTYDMEFAEPIGVTRTAVLMTFKDGLIARSELFFDARPFGRK
jgi:ketosteroid isomerase-like protein